MRSARAVGIVDQTLFSASNFAVALICARALGPAEFGGFALAYLCLLLIGTLHRSLLLEALSVIRANPGDTIDASRFTRGSGAATLILAIAVMVAGLLTAVIAAIAGASSNSRELAIALGVATGPWLLQEFGRRVAYASQRPAIALKANATSYGLQATVVASLAVHGSLSPAKAILAIGLSSLPAVVLYQRAGLLRLTLRGSRYAMAHSRRFAQTLPVAALAFWLAFDGYYYLLAALEGASSAGDLRASQTLLAPVNVPLLAMAITLPPKLARINNDGGRLRGIAFHETWLVLTAVTAYCAAIVVVGPLLSDALLGAEYSVTRTDLAIFSLFFVLSVPANVLVAALLALHSPGAVLWSNIAALITAGIVAVPLVAYAGVTGAVTGMAVARLVTLVACFVPFNFLCQATAGSRAASLSLVQSSSSLVSATTVSQKFGVLFSTRLRPRLRDPEAGDR